jgi:hypothetical protein
MILTRYRDRNPAFRPIDRPTDRRGNGCIAGVGRSLNETVAFLA